MGIPVSDSSALADTLNVTYINTTRSLRLRSVTLIAKITVLFAVYGFSYLCHGAIKLCLS